MRKNLEIRKGSHALGFVALSRSRARNERRPGRAPRSTVGRDSLAWAGRGPHYLDEPARDGAVRPQLGPGPAERNAWRTACPSRDFRSLQLSPRLERFAGMGGRQ